MASVTKYRQKWLKYHKSYEKRAFNILRKQFKNWNNKIMSIDFDETLIKTQLALSTNFEDLYQTYYDIYYNIGRIHGKRVGNDINIELKAFTMVDFMALFEKELPMFLRNFGITRIQLVHKSYLDVIFEMFNQRLLEGKTLKETTDEVFKIMRSPRFYRWEAERIARTETTAAANYAAVKSGKVSGFLMQKHWISATDARTRRKPKAHFDHAEMNGKKVGIDEDFIFNENTLDEDRLSFAGDPKGKAGNVINCRCTVSVIPARDKKGNLIRI